MQHRFGRNLRQLLVMFLFALECKSKKGDMRWDALPWGGTGYICEGMGEGVFHNETYRSPLESRVESRPPCEVAAIAFRGVRHFNSEFCACRLLPTQYLPSIMPHEMQYLKDSISVYTEIYGIAHTYFQLSPLSVFFGKMLVEQHEILSVFPCENSSIYTVKCISRQAKRLA